MGFWANSIKKMTNIQKNWEPRNTVSLPDNLPELASKLGISPWLAGILYSRGLNSLEELDFFLSPGLRSLVPPCNWPGVEAAAQIIVQGLLAGHKLAVWGDYDVDGVTSTALVKTVLAWHGFKVEHYLPHRSQDGYGLNIKGVEKLSAQGVNILLTVDCGISDHAPIARANELGMIVVLTDHHLPAETLPAAAAICNPALPNSPYPSLAGVGMAFFLMAQVNNLLSEKNNLNKSAGPTPKAKPDIRDVLDLVALGTLADMVPLSGQNRILAKNGLLLISEGKRPGIAALKAVAGFAPASNLSAGQVTFTLAPRINAAGRLDHADDALALLLATSVEEAQTLAEKLDAMNKARRTQEEEIFQEAHAKAQELLATNPNLPALVLFDPSWHPGIIGIVASRIVEVYYKPTIILCQDNDIIKGSGRSIKELNLHTAVTACEALLLRYGGHHQAVGLSLAPELLPEFQNKFCKAVIEAIGPNSYLPTLRYDAEANFATASDGTNLNELELLQPFGIKNPEPIFISPPLLLKSVTPFGHGNYQQGGHVRLELSDESSGITLRVKAWRQAKAFPSTGCGRYLKIAYSVRIDHYNGTPSVDINLRDWRWLA